MAVFRYNYTSNSKHAKHKAYIAGTPLGQHEVTAKNKEEAINAIQKNHNGADTRPVAGINKLKNGKVLKQIIVNTHVKLKKPYRGSDCNYYDTGIVVELLLNNRYGVRLYNSNGYYVGSPNNPITVDFSEYELVGVPTPASFKLTT